jgi:long-subunit fatty acid transport protein
MVFAGGLLTNTNQSAQFIRMMSRNASTEIDAVYFNPAGLIKLENGWHFAVSSQTIFQTKPVETEFPLLNNGNYEGVVNVPVFPTGFGVYKMDNWAFSLGFGPNAGGGAAKYDRGLPSFEIPITKVVPGLAGLAMIDPSWKVDGYNADISFDGSSVFWGIQLGATYQISDIFSVYGGVRYLPAKNTYQGVIENIQLKVNSDYVSAAPWMTEKSGQTAVLAGLANAAADMPQTLQPLIDGGAADFTLAQLELAGRISAAQRLGIETGLQMMELSPEQINAMSLGMIQGAFEEASPTFRATAAQLSGASGSLAETAGKLGDKNVNTVQTGNGFTPMVGLNISPVENLNIALKYEMKTGLTLKNEPQEGDNYSNELFGSQVASDIPAILAAGVGYKTGIVEAQLSYNMYFNKGVNWGVNIRDYAAGHDPVRQREIAQNGIELGLGLQFDVHEKFALSVGGLYGDMGVADNYQSDFSYTNPSVTGGIGFAWKITDALTLDAGFSNTFYQDVTVSFTDPDVGNYKEHLKKTTQSFAIGLSYSLF